MGTRPDVLVVGGGVIGLTSAYLLAKSGLKVEVVDKGEMGREASWAGAGILPPWGEGEYATPLDRLRAYSVSRFAELSAELRELTGIDNEYHVCGGVEFLSHVDGWLPDVWRREGIRHEPFDGLCPPGTTGYRLPFAQVRNPRHLKALIEGCLRVGVKLSPNTPFPGWRAVAGRPVVVAAGAWADELVGPLGVRPVMGEMVLFNPGGPVLDGIRIRNKHYLVPRRDGRVLAGSTEWPERGFEKQPTIMGVEGLLMVAASLVPVLTRSTVETAWAGLRPGSPDGVPFIGPVPTRPNVFVAVGHFRAGIQLSIATAECVTALVHGKQPPVPLEPFAIGRKPRHYPWTAFRS